MGKKKRKQPVKKEPYNPRHVNELWAKDVDDFTESDWSKVTRLIVKLRRLSRYAQCVTV